MNINGITSVSGLNGTNSMPVGDKAEQSKSTNFASMLQAYTDQINHDKKAAAVASENLVTGQGGSTSETLLAIQKADLSFQMMLSVRNKLVEAYREVSRMQV